MVPRDTRPGPEARAQMGRKRVRTHTCAGRGKQAGPHNPPKAGLCSPLRLFVLDQKEAAIPPL